MLRQVHKHLYRRLKAIANANRRSMNQEAILALAAGLPGEPAPQRPDVETSRHWLQRQIWNLPLQGRRSAEAILGFGDDGLCHSEHTRRSRAGAPLTGSATGAGGPHPHQKKSWWWPLLHSQAGPGTPQGTSPAQCRKMSRLRASISSSATKPSMAKRPLIRSA